MEEKLSYRTCKVCGNTYPLTNEYFDGVGGHNGMLFKHTCKECVDRKQTERYWKNGLLYCTKCKKYKPEDDFSNNGKDGNPIRHGKKTHCKECENAYRRGFEKALSNEDAIIAKLKMLYFAAKARAKSKELDFDLTVESLKELWDSQEGKCAISSIPMTYIMTEGRQHFNVSIDKINPNLGYTQNNIQLVCSAVNTMKYVLTMEELYMFCEAIIKNKKN